MVTLEIYEDILPGLEARVRNALPADSEPVTVRINSYGGAIDVGYTVRNILSDYAGSVTCVVDGVAASAASVIAVGGSDELVMRAGSELMIHQASMGAGGNAGTLRAQADRLDKMDWQLAEVYAAKAGGSPESWFDLMEKETWFSADEAVAVGLADRIDGHAVQAVSIDRIAAKYNYRGRQSPPLLMNEKEATMGLKDFANELGMSESEVKAVFNRIKNETVETTVKVDVSYPQDTRIVPTETVTIYPVIGQPAASSDGEAVDPAQVTNADPAAEPAPVAAEVIDGIVFELTGEAEGFTATVDEKSGALKITASSGVEVGSEAELTISVSGTAVPVKVAVRSLSEDPATDPADSAAPVAAPVENVVTVDKHTYNELVEGNRAYAKVLEQRAREDRHARVDEWVNEGRIAASARSEAIKVIDRDEKLAEEIYGSRAVNTVPRREIGHVGFGEPLSKSAEAIAKANANRKNRK